MLISLIHMSPTPVTLNVRGSASLEVPPDYASVSLSADATRATRESALEVVQSTVFELRQALEDRPDVRAVSLSRIRVQEATEYDRDLQTRVHTGWTATVTGKVLIDTDHVTVVVARVAATAGEIGYLSWYLDDDNEAYRQVRVDAVADAFRAAGDFAGALNRQLGELRVLADPGLLSAQAAEAEPMARAMAFDGAAGGIADDGVEIELDPEMQTVYASVEATFDVL